MKSFVTLEQHRCLVCGQDYATGNLLLDQKMREMFEMETVTGMGICPEHEKLYVNGFIALVGVDPAKTPRTYNNTDDGKPAATVKTEDAHRTGSVAHLKFEAFARLFGKVPTDGKGRALPMVFVDEAVIDKLKELSEGAKP